MAFQARAMTDENILHSPSPLPLLWTSGLHPVLLRLLSGRYERRREALAILPRGVLRSSARPPRDARRARSGWRAPGGLASELPRAGLPFMVAAPRPQAGPAGGGSAAVRPRAEACGFPEGSDRSPPYAPPAGVGLGAGVAPEPRLRRRRAEGRVCGVAGWGRSAPPPIPPRASRGGRRGEDCGRPRPRAPALAPSLLVTAWAPAQINFLALFKTAAARPLCAAQGPRSPPGPPETPRGAQAPEPGPAAAAPGRGKAETQGRPPGGWRLWISPLDLFFLTHLRGRRI